MNVIECQNCFKETSIDSSICEKCKGYRHKSNIEKAKQVLII